MSEQNQEAKQESPGQESYDPAETDGLSDQKLAANRKNALASTGPRTPEGKAVVSKNGMLHGISSKDLIVTTKWHEEKIEDFESLHEALREDLCPHGATQELLVQRIAISWWRLAPCIPLRNRAHSG